MKERVLTTLQSLTNSSTEEAMMDLLCEELQTDRKKLAGRSAALLNAILHNYGEFSIGTIDSFVHRIVRTFAIDLRLPINFNIETNRDRVLAACVDELARKVGEDETITKVLVEFSRTRMEEDRNWRVDEEIFSFARKLLDEEGMMRLEKIRKVDISSLLNARDVMNDYVKRFSSTLKQLATEAIDYFSKEGLSAEDFYQGVKGIWNYYKKVQEGVFDDENLLKSYVLKTIDESKWKSGKSRLSESQIQSAENFFHSIEKERNQGKEKYFTYKALLGNIYSLMVISEIEKILSAIKEQENIIFISEFNRMIADVIREEPVPFIYERIGEKYKHFLLDEFQDTSRVQWYNLLPLLDNSLASGNFNLVVGDGKQSIYRWRGGDVEQFAGLPDVQGSDDAVVFERQQSLERNYTEKILAKNFRSTETIIDFNNRFYAFLQKNILPAQFSKVYENSEQSGRDDKKVGYVSFDFVSAESGDATDLLVCNETEKYILQNVNEHGYSYSDITVLVRNKNNGKKVADYLVAKGIPIVSSESLLLNASETVGALLSVLHLLPEERSHIHEAKVLLYLHNKKMFPGKSYADIWKEFSDAGVPIGDWLNKKQLADLRRNKLILLPLFEVCAAIICELSLEKDDPLFIQYFLDKVLEYSGKNRENLNAFLDWWGQHADSCSAVLPKGANAVNIMTIHASKGLQFPVVIIPFADWECYKADYLWVDLKDENIPQLETTMVTSPSQLNNTPYASLAEDEKSKQLLDNVNLLYVATTRAEAHMHIISRNRNRVGYVDKWLFSFFSGDGNASDGHFSFGNMDAKKDGKQKHSLLLKYGFPLHDWNELLTLKLSGADYPEISQRQEKRADGVLFHKAMSRIFVKSDLGSLSAWLVAKNLCSAEKAQLIFEKVNALFKNSSFAVLFPEKVHSLNEPEILNPGKNFRPDRVVFLNDETWVIDYKTGGEKAEYIQQINDYGDALTEMNYPNIRKFIVYVEDERVEEPGVPAPSH